MVAILIDHALSMPLTHRDLRICDAAAKIRRIVQNRMPEGIDWPTQIVDMYHRSVLLKQQRERDSRSARIRLNIVDILQVVFV